MRSSMTIGEVAHRAAVNVGGLDPERVKQALHVVCPDIECVLLVGSARRSIAAGVVVENLEVLGHGRRHGPVAGMAGDRTRDLQHPRALTLDDVIDVYAVDSDDRHSVLLLAET